MQFKIPVAAGNVRSIKSPQPKDSESESKVRIVHAYVSVSDLPDNIPLDPDPRAPKSTGEVPKRIKSSLLSNDGKFHLKNRGITISVKHCELDNKRNVLTLTIPDGEEQWGILDGAHTYRCINEGVAEERRRL